MTRAPYRPAPRGAWLLALCLPLAAHAQHRYAPPPATPATPPAAPQPADPGTGLDAPVLPMAMLDDPLLASLRVDHLETTHADGTHGQAWDLTAWYGNDEDKLWLRSDGDHRAGEAVEGAIEALWDHAFAPYWDSQLGVRSDFGPGPHRGWLAFGLQGLAPYWFSVEATGYLGAHGRTAARLKVDYELLLTQRWILEPELEANLYGRADRARRIGAGLSDASVGLRLRYEIDRQFAPYVGLVRSRRFGATADLARHAGERANDWQWVAGVRLWF